MSRRQNDIEALITHSRKQLPTVEQKYQSSLTAKSVSPELKIEIKNLCENLRSALDYLAHDIRECQCPNAKDNDRFYFPILQDKRQFETRVREWFPGLDTRNPKLWSYLESLQPYQGSQTAWLGDLNRINNENKHAALVEQTRTETERIRATSANGGIVEWSPQNVRFGNGVYIGGVPVNPATQLPVPHPSLEVKRIIWIDFKFEGINRSALGLLKQSVDGIGQIADRVYELLGG